MPVEQDALFELTRNFVNAGGDVGMDAAAKFDNPKSVAWTTLHQEPWNKIEELISARYPNREDRLKLLGYTEPMKPQQALDILGLDSQGLNDLADSINTPDLRNMIPLWLTARALRPQTASERKLVELYEAKKMIAGLMHAHQESQAINRP